MLTYLSPSFSQALGVAVTFMNTAFNKSDFSPVWVYVVGPIGGALLASALFALLHAGRDEDTESTQLSDGADDTAFATASYAFRQEYSSSYGSVGAVL